MSLHWIINIYFAYIFNTIISTCPSKEEITAEIKTTEVMLKPSSVSTAADSVPKTKLSNVSPSEISLMPHPKRISNKTEPLKPTSSLSFTLRCSTVLDVEFTQELWKSGQTKTERTELLPKEYKEMQVVKLLMPKRNDSYIRLSWNTIIKARIFHQAL